MAIADFTDQAYSLWMAHDEPGLDMLAKNEIEDNDIVLQRLMGAIYAGLTTDDGKCPIKSTEKAIEWYKKAASNGDGLSFFYLATLVWDDKPKALEYLMKAEELNCHRALAWIGHIYLYDYEDIEKGMYYLEKGKNLRYIHASLKFYAYSVSTSESLLEKVSARFKYTIVVLRNLYLTTFHSESERLQDYDEKFICSDREQPH